MKYFSDRLLGNSGRYIIRKVPVAVYGLAPDGANPKSPFFDVRVRRAIEHAIDKERLVKTTFYGVFTAINQIAYPKSANHNPSIKGYPYNPKKARELLAQAGYPNGFKTKIIYRTTDSADYNTAIQAYLKDVGIEAELEPVTLTRWSQIINTGWENALITWYLTIGVSSDPGQFLLRTFTNNSVLYKSIVHDKKIDSIIDRAIAETDMKKRNVLYRESTALINDTFAIVCPIYIGYALTAQVPGIHDVSIETIGGTKPTPHNAWLSIQ